MTMYKLLFLTYFFSSICFSSICFSAVENSPKAELQQAAIGLHSIKLADFADFLGEWDAIVVVGPSCAGKTTLVNALRKAQIDRLVFPKRFITRERRGNDDLVENAYITENELELLKQEKMVDIMWQRDLGKAKKEWYAFEVIDSQKRNHIPVYSANNALIEAGNALINHSIIIHIAAPEEIRKERLEGRSPDIKTNERAIRLKAADSSLKHHILVENFGSNAERSQSDIVEFVQRLLKNR